MAWIDGLFKMMSEKKASDLHMTSEHVPMVRSSGDMMTLPEGVPKLSRDQMLQILLEIAPERNRKQFEESFDTDFAYALEGFGRFRCNYFNDRYGPGAVFRRIPDKILSAEQLGLPAGVMRLTEYKKGLVLGHRPDRIGQVGCDHPGGDGRPTSTATARSTSSPSRTRSSSSTRRRSAW